MSACGLLELGPESEITTTELASVRVSVVELGPLNPGRVALPSAAPVSEFMPGDRVRIEVEVVEPDGLPVPAEEIESIWLHWGSGLQGQFGSPRLNDPAFDVRCEALEDWSPNSMCRLGEGDAGIEFVAPPLAAPVEERVWFYGVLAWNGASAEDCWTARREGEAFGPDCGFVSFNAHMGPRWWMLRHAAEQGLATPLPTDTLPAPALAQQANRPPLLDALDVDVEGKVGYHLVAEDTGFGTTVGPAVVEAGDRMTLWVNLDFGLQATQTIFYPVNPEGDAFGVGVEAVEVRTSTTGPLRYTGLRELPLGVPVIVEVDERAEPGTARVLLAIHDYRGGENLIRLEVEIGE